MSTRPPLGLVTLPPLLLLAACSDAKLDESRIHAMLNEITTAVAKRDADAAASHFAPDAIITIVLPRAGGTQRLSPSQYRIQLMVGWRAIAQSSYQASNVRIAIAPDSTTARVTQTVKETVSLLGQSITTVSDQQLSVALQNGKPRIAALTARFR